MCACGRLERRGYGDNHSAILHVNACRGGLPFRLDRDCSGDERAGRFVVVRARSRLERRGDSYDDSAVLH